MAELGTEQSPVDRINALIAARQSISTDLKARWNAIPEDAMLGTARTKRAWDLLYWALSSHDDVACDRQIGG